MLVAGGQKSHDLHTYRRDLDAQENSRETATTFNRKRSSLGTVHHAAVIRPSCLGAHQPSGRCIATGNAQSHDRSRRFWEGDILIQGVDRPAQNLVLEGGKIGTVNSRGVCIKNMSRQGPEIGAKMDRALDD